MSFSKEERRLIHKKAQQPLMGNGVPSNLDGKENDVDYRRIPNKGSVHYVKRDGEWQALSSTDSLPAERNVTKATISTSGGTSSSVTDHGSMSGLTHDDHAQYLLINGTRAMTGGLSISGDAALNFTAAGENSIRIPDNQASALIIEEAGNAYLTFVTTDSGEKITLGKKLEAGSVEIEGTAFDINGGDISAATVSGGLTWSAAQNLNSQNLTNVNIDSGTIDAVTLGTNSAVTEAQIDNININGNIINATSGTLQISAAGGTVDFDNDDIVTSGDLEIDGTANLDTVDIDGNTQVDGTITVGVDDTGYDVKFFGATASAYMLWDESEDDLVLSGAAGINVDGTSNLDNTDIDGTLVVDGTNISLDSTSTLNIDNSNTTNGITIGTATSSVPISIGHTTSVITLNDEVDITGTLDINDVTDSSSTTTGALKVDGGVGIAKKLYVGTNLDVDGTSNLDAVDIDGNTQMDGTLTVGINDTGYDVLFYGASRGAFFQWDQSEDTLEIRGADADASTSTGKLKLSTSLIDINDGDVLGRIDFGAPLEDSGSDAILNGASIWAEADGTFSSTVNSTELVFATNTSALATERMRIDSSGNVGIGVSDPDTKLEILHAGVQQKWSYNASVYATLEVDSSNHARLVTPSGYIFLNAGGGEVRIKDGSQTVLIIDGATTAGDAIFKDAGAAEIFRIDGSENSVRFTGYGLTNSDPYAVSIKPLNSTQHMTMGLADKQNNYSMIGIYSLAAAAISGVTADSDFDGW